MTLFSDTFYLARAGRYADPLNSNDRLPVVYGDLTDGSLGIWVLPCIDTDDDVFCYAGHAVLSAANGNTVTIYENDLELDPGLYTFSESNNYEGAGTIATITFSSPKTGSIITARGKGKATGATLIENIVDIVYDFLTVENDFTSSDFDSTTKAAVKALFTAQGYKAAGVIDQDTPIWTILMQMMSSFLGSVWVNTGGELVFDLDINGIAKGPAAVFRKTDMDIKQAKIRLENLVNQCPCNYAYNNYDAEFKGHSDASAHADAASQSIFGVRKPAAPYQFYWCRDLTSVQAVQDIIVEKLKNPLYELEVVSQSVKYPHVELGDVIMMSAERLYDPDGLQLLNRYWKAMAVKPDYSANQITFGLVDTGYFYTIAYLADGGTLAEVASGSVDRDDMRLCLADGVAFVGFDGVDLSAYEGVRTGYKLTLTDAADKETVGFFSSADAAEALGGELMTNGTFDADVAGWTKDSFDTLEWDASAAAHAAVSAPGVVKMFYSPSFAFEAGKLYKLTFSLQLNSGSLPVVVFTTSSVFAGIAVSGGLSIPTQAGANIIYFTPASGGAGFEVYFCKESTAASTDILLDDVVLKEVTDAGEQAIHVVSASSGATRNWASIEAGFDYNEADGYTYKIEAGRLADGSVLAGNNRDTTIY